MLKNMFEKGINLESICIFKYFGQTLGLHLSYFLRPQCCKPRILEDLTDIVIISQTFTL